jgi:hypothetical protein
LGCDPDRNLGRDRDEGVGPGGIDPPVHFVDEEMLGTAEQD